MNKVLTNLLRLWNGNQQLVIAFWGLFVPVFILSRLFKYIMASNNIDDYVVISSIVLFILLALKAFSLVAVWRCAPNVKVKSSLLPMIARGVVVLSLLPIVVSVLAVAVSILNP